MDRKRRKELKEGATMTPEEFDRWARTGDPTPARFWWAALVLGAVVIAVWGTYALVIIGADAMGWLGLPLIVGAAIVFLAVSVLALARKPRGK